MGMRGGKSTGTSHSPPILEVREGQECWGLAGLPFIGRRFICPSLENTPSGVWGSSGKVSSCPVKVSPGDPGCPGLVLPLEAMETRKMQLPCHDAQRRRLVGSGEEISCVVRRHTKMPNAKCHQMESLPVGEGKDDGEKCLGQAKGLGTWKLDRTQCIDNEPAGLHVPPLLKAPRIKTRKVQKSVEKTA